MSYPFSGVLFRLFALALMLAAPAGAQTKDARGSSDHALFPNRMPGYSISFYKQADFESMRFQVPGKPVVVEGRKTTINYRLQSGKAHPGDLAIRRNYENAVVAAGGQVLYKTSKSSVLKIAKDGAETWVEIRSSSGPVYFLTILERTAMTQAVTANAMLDALNRSGMVALNILFETGKAQIKAESQGQIGEISAMMKANPSLDLAVGGHTDAVGTAASNKALSKARAEAVVAALVAQGVESRRLDAAGYGAEKPVADNRTEAGRAQNRRVELVKKK